MHSCNKFEDITIINPPITTFDKFRLNNPYAFSNFIL